MRLDEVLRTANNSSEEYTEKDVVDLFKRKNYGHWPSESGEVVIETDNGNIVLTIGRKMVGSNRILNPQGKAWLINKFFEGFSPEALKDIKSLEEYQPRNRRISPSEKSNPQKFHNRVVKRMSQSKTQFVKSGNTRLAFVERKRLNNDESVLYSYDINILDCDKTSKYALMLPGLKPYIQVFEEYKGEIVKSTISVDGRTFGDMEPWERAEYIAMTHIDIFNFQKVSKEYLNAAFLLTESYDPDQIQFFNQFI